MTIILSSYFYLMTPETQLKRQVKQYLNLKGIWHFHNLAGMGVYKGIPDDFVVHRGKIYGLEYKSPTGKLSPYQEAFKAYWELHGLGNCIWVTVRNLDDIISIFK